MIMKLDLNPIKVGIAVVVLLTGLNYSGALGDEYTKQWGPPLGESVPVLEAYDHTGALRTLANLTGERGLLLSMNRSADW